jgi:UDP-GlcNAc:undecaprenyl-phosphate GlcNAc-1-phosphate transferase
MSHLSCALVSAGVALLVTPLVRALARRSNLVDSPHARKLQPHAVPLLGGAAVLVAAGVGWLSSPLRGRLPSEFASVAFLLAAAAGLLDDLRKDRFPTAVKTALLALAALAGGYALRPYGGGVRLVFAMLWCFTVVNASNLSDNANGLSPGLAAVPYLALLLTGRVEAVGEARGAVLACTAGAALGFLPFNFPRASIFLGDLGAYGLGAILALTLDPLTLGALAPALVAVPLLDLFWVTACRLSLGLPPWRADRRHLSHHLMALGVGEARAVTILWAVALATGVVAVWITR